MDPLSLQLREEALEVQKNEPELALLLSHTVLATCVESFEDAVASTVCYRLLLKVGKLRCANGAKNGTAGIEEEESPPAAADTSAMFCPTSLLELVGSTMTSPVLEQGHTMSEAIREDALSVVRRDPAVNSVLEVVLFSKGYAALVCHRAAHRLWKRRKYTALFLQSQASAAFGLDIHPLTRIGYGVMFDHGTGIVTGETAMIGDGTTILHGVTLGGTGKEQGDRHPKVGKYTLIGAGSSLLGNITIGDGAKIGAGSVVLRNIPPHATAVGAPARIIGRATEDKPGSDVDGTLQKVSLLHKSDSTISTVSLSDLSEDDQSTPANVILTSPATPGNIDPTCPFREYTRLAKEAPPGTVTICSLYRLLSTQGCSGEEIGNSFFELDTRNVGYVTLDEFRKRANEVLARNTKLDEAKIESLISPY